MFTSTVKGNGGNGINVTGHSKLQLGFERNGNGEAGSSVTNSSGAGILVLDLSFANFPDGVTIVVTGSGSAKWSQWQTVGGAPNEHRFQAARNGETCPMLKWFHCRDPEYDAG